jgi:hypothetical protein
MSQSRFLRSEQQELPTPTVIDFIVLWRPCISLALRVAGSHSSGSTIVCLWMHRLAFYPEYCFADRSLEALQQTVHVERISHSIADTPHQPYAAMENRPSAHNL